MYISLPLPGSLFRIPPRPSIPPDYLQGTSGIEPGSRTYHSKGKGGRWWQARERQRSHGDDNMRRCVHAVDDRAGRWTKDQTKDIRVVKVRSEGGGHGLYGGKGEEDGTEDGDKEEGCHRPRSVTLFGEKYTSISQKL